MIPIPSFFFPLWEFLKMTRLAGVDDDLGQCVPSSIEQRFAELDL
jgi:hypothetical protein